MTVSKGLTIFKPWRLQSPDQRTNAHHEPMLVKLPRAVHKTKPQPEASLSG